MQDTQILGGSKMVYDCFQFFNELDLLKLRLNVMDSVVDKFVISEATETFSGKKKPLYYQENKEMFREFEHKIIHLIVKDTPKGHTHDRDTFQKNAVGRGLVHCKEEDVIIFSDLDELPNPIKIKEILLNMEVDKIYHFAQRMFYCYLNMEEVSGKLLSYAGDFEGVSRPKWIGSKMCQYGLLQELGIPIGELRYPARKEIGIRVDNGGWHFGYMGGNREGSVQERIIEKVKSAAHQEFNNVDTLAEVGDNIKDGKDIFGRQAEFVKVPIDHTYPEYLLQHKEEYSFLILEDEKKIEKALRNLKREIRKIVRFMKKVVRKLKRMCHKG